MTKRTIAVLTGKRGGFGAMLTLMRKIEEDPNLNLELIVTDMHLSPMFGMTVNEITKSFPKMHRVDLKQEGDSGEARSEALGRAVIGFTKTLSSIKPDLFVVLGDRGEVLAAATAALELNIPIAHILGGDVAGNRDGIRIHAITKLAHLHFPANQDAYERILALGEESWRVSNFGSTYIDLPVRGEYTKNADARASHGIEPEEPYILCIQHPMTLDESRSYTEAKAVYGALAEKGLKTIVVWPCSDQGYEGVLKALAEFEDASNFRIFKNIEAPDFWGLMEGASLMIGNSSSGLMETPYFNLPSITVGKRQEGRERDTNVITVIDPTRENLLDAIDRALSPDFHGSLQNHYLFGKGNAGARIADVLRMVELGDKLLRKQITF